MNRHTPIRWDITIAAAALAIMPALVFAQPNRPNTPIKPAASQPRPVVRANPQEHLGQWMATHRNLPLSQQQSALEREPGFQTLKPEMQQRMRDRLTQLNAMQPAQRDRVIARTEAMERLSPPQRQQVRGAMAELGAIPPDRRRVVSQTFRDMRDMPPDQRQAYMNSEWYRGQFNDQERNTLTNLIAVEPYLPR